MLPPLKAAAAAEWRLADAAALHLAAVPSRSLNDVAPKVMVAAWLRCHSCDDQGSPLAVLETAIANDTLALQPPLHLD